MPTHNRSRLDAIVIFFCSLVMFTLGLRHQEIIGFESRFYLFALEMWRHGVSWFPTTYQQPYPDYPVTSTLLIYGVAKLVGGLNKLVAVLPSAIAAALTVSATYLIGAVQERRWGWYGAGFLLFTLAFITEARTISLDMYVTSVTAWVFYFVYSARQQNQTIAWFLVLFCVVFGFAVRGPIGLVIPTGVICGYFLAEKDWRGFWLSGIAGLLILTGCTAVLLWIAHHAGGTQLMHDVLRMEVFGRMQENQTPSHYFYFIESFGAYALSYPLAILVLLGCSAQLIRDHHSPRMQLLRLLCMWVLVVMVGLSIPADKKVRYILSIAPALALICAYLFAAVQTGFLYYLKKIIYGLFGIFPLFGLGLLFALHRHQVVMDYSALSALFVVMQVVISLARHEALTFFLAVLTFVSINIFVIENMNVSANQTQAFVLELEKERAAQHAQLAFYHEGRDGLVIKYLLNMPQEENPVFITDLKKNTVKKMLIIAAQDNFDALPIKLRQTVKVIKQGKIGHDAVVVFVLK